MIAITYRFNVVDLSILKLLALLLIVVAALPTVAMLATALWPLVVMAAPVVGQVLFAGLCIVAFAMATKPA